MRYEKIKYKYILRCYKLLLLLSGCVKEAVQTLPQREWELVWSDDFTGTAGTSPDNAKWSFDIGTGINGWGNSELQYYTNRPSNAQKTVVVI